MDKVNILGCFVFNRKKRYIQSKRVTKKVTMYPLLNLPNEVLVFIVVKSTWARYIICTMGHTTAFGAHAFFPLFSRKKMNWKLSKKSPLFWDRLLKCPKLKWTINFEANEVAAYAWHFYFSINCSLFESIWVFFCCEIKMDITNLEIRKFSFDAKCHFLRYLIIQKNLKNNCHSNQKNKIMA